MFIINKQVIGDKAADENTIHIVFGVDSKFIFPTGLAMTSIMKYNENVMFYIFVDCVKKKDIVRIEKFTAEYHTKCILYYVDNTKLLNFQQTSMWNWATYLRFIAAETLAEQLPRILYLDADIMCCGSLKELFFTNMEDKPLAAIKDAGMDDEAEHNRKLAIGITSSYFNAGILLIDLKFYKENNITERAFSLLNDRPERWKMLDQDVLNHLFNENVLFMPMKYNMQTCDLSVGNNQNNAIIIHFTGFKPWQKWNINEINKCVDNKYKKLYMESYWCDEPFWNPETAYQCRMMSKKELKNHNYFGYLFYQYKYLKRKLFVEKGN